MNHGAYATRFSVVDCFKEKTISGRFKSDSIKQNYVMKGTQVWRAINLENRQNGVLFNSNNACAEIGLFEIIKFGLLELKLNAFYSDDFHPFRSHIEPKQVKSTLYLTDSSEIQSFDSDGNSQTVKTHTNRYLNGTDIKGYLIKEDWILNSHSGKTEKYVIGLAPLVYDAKHGKIIPLLWLYYPEWEELLALFEAKNFYSHQRISYKDVFEKKYFVSLISKESNIFDRAIRAYKHGYDAYLESEQVKERLSSSEADLFQY